MNIQHAINLTKHARARSQQRAIPEFVMDLLVSYGKSKRRHGAEVYYLDKFSRKQLRQYIGSIIYSRISDLLDCYVVIADDGAVITTGKRLKQIKLR